MTPEPCPTCKGFCCRADSGLTFPHREATFYVWHVCPDCDDGTYEVCGDPEPAPKPVRTYEDGIAEGERRATAAVVAWLRGFDTETQSASSDLRWCIRGLANCVERGDHRREEKP